MDILLNRLIGLVEEETDLYGALLSVLQKEKEAVVSSDLKELNEGSKQKESLILKIRILEEQRLTLLKKLADSLGHSSQYLTLTQVYQVVDEPYSSRLRESSSNLSALVQSIQEVNHTNKALLIHSIELVRGSLSLLHNLIASNPVYHHTGKVQTGDQSGKVLSGKI